MVVVILKAGEVVPPGYVVRCPATGKWMKGTGAALGMPLDEKVEGKFGVPAAVFLRSRYKQRARGPGGEG